MPTTIGRNRRQYVINVRNTYTRCERYDAATQTWETVDSGQAWKLLDDHRAARLMEEDDKESYSIVLRNEWYLLKKPSSGTS